MTHAETLENANARRRDRHPPITDFGRMKVALPAAIFFSLLSSFVSAQTGPSQLHWPGSQSGVGRLGRAMSIHELQALFDNPITYEIMNAPNKPDPLPHARNIAFYRDETQIGRDLAAGKLAGVDGVLYDDEAYDEPGNTAPSEQKENPLPYVQDAAKVLHAAGKVFIYTIGPGVGPKGQFWTTTLPAVSPYPDVIDFQTQAAEGTPRFAKVCLDGAPCQGSLGGSANVSGADMSTACLRGRDRPLASMADPFGSFPQSSQRVGIDADP